MRIQGFELSAHVDFILQTLLVIQLICSFFVYGIALPYNQQSQETILFKQYQCWSLLLLAVDIFSKIVCKKMKGEIKLRTIKDISKDYLKGSLFIDVLYLLILGSDIWITWEGFKFLRLVFLYKMKEISSKLLTIEQYMINSFER